MRGPVGVTWVRAAEGRLRAVVGSCRGMCPTTVAGTGRDDLRRALGGDAMQGIAAGRADLAGSAQAALAQR